MATATAAEQIISKIDGISKRLDPLEGLLKTLEAPAKRDGLSPEAYLARMVDRQEKGGSKFTTFSDLGNRDFKVGRMYSKGLGDCRDDEGREGNFGLYLKNLYDLAYHGPGQTKAQVEYLERLGVQRLRAEQDKDGAEYIKTALAESAGVTGGYTVPPMFANNLLTLAIEDSVVAPRAAKQPLTSRTLQVPSLDITTAYGAGQSPFLGGIAANWVSEAATRTETEPQFRQTVLNAWELSFYTVASNTLLADNAVGLDSLLTQLFSSAIAWYTDYAFLQGNGVGKPLGILNAPATISVTKNQTAHFNWFDISNMLKSFYWLLRGSNSIAWFIHPTVIQDLYRMNDMSGSQTNQGAGRLLFQTIDRGAQEPIPTSAGVQSCGYLCGWPVLVTEKLPALGTTGCVLLADCSKYLLGTRQEIQIDVSPHVNFLKNQMTWRVVWRGDGQPWLNQAITLADGTATVSPFVQLTQ